MTIVRPINDKTPNVSGSFSNRHRGTDYAYSTGTPVYNAQAGKVVALVNLYNKNWTNNGKLTTADYGNFIKIDHGNGYSSIYAHLRYGMMQVKSGDYVNRGQQIAEVGNTGNSTGAHLHFEFRKNESAVNPWGYMERDFSWYY